MAEKTILLAAFPYTDADGRMRDAMRGDRVNVDGADLERGERLGAFATEADLKPDAPFGKWLATNRPSAVEPEPVVTQPEPVATVKPSGKDSREKWVDYARSKDAPETELVSVEQGGLTRDQLREQYGA